MDESARCPSLPNQLEAQSEPGVLPGVARGGVFEDTFAEFADLPQPDTSEAAKALPSSEALEWEHVYNAWVREAPDSNQAFQFTRATSGASGRVPAAGPTSDLPQGSGQYDQSQPSGADWQHALRYTAPLDRRAGLTGVVSGHTFMAYSAYTGPVAGSSTAFAHLASPPATTHAAGPPQLMQQVQPGAPIPAFHLISAAPAAPLPTQLPTAQLPPQQPAQETHTWRRLAAGLGLRAGDGEPQQPSVCKRIGRLLIASEEARVRELGAAGRALEAWAPRLQAPPGAPEHGMAFFARGDIETRVNSGGRGSSRQPVPIDEGPDPKRFLFAVSGQRCAACAGTYTRRSKKPRQTEGGGGQSGTCQGLGHDYFKVTEYVVGTTDQSTVEARAYTKKCSDGVERKLMVPVSPPLVLWQIKALVAGGTPAAPPHDAAGHEDSAAAGAGLDVSGGQGTAREAFAASAVQATPPTADPTEVGAQGLLPQAASLASWGGCPGDGAAVLGSARGGSHPVALHCVQQRPSRRLQLSNASAKPQQQQGQPQLHPQAPDEQLQAVLLEALSPPVPREVQPAWLNHLNRIMDLLISCRPAAEFRSLLREVPPEHLLQMHTQDSYGQWLPHLLVTPPRHLPDGNLPGLVPPTDPDEGLPEAEVVDMVQAVIDRLEEGLGREEGMRAWRALLVRRDARHKATALHRAGRYGLRYRVLRAVLQHASREALLVPTSNAWLCYHSPLRHGHEAAGRLLVEAVVRLAEELADAARQGLLPRAPPGAPDLAAQARPGLVYTLKNKYFRGTNSDGFRQPEDRTGAALLPKICAELESRRRAGPGAAGNGGPEELRGVAGPGEAAAAAAAGGGGAASQPLLPTCDRPFPAPAPLQKRPKAYELGELRAWARLLDHMRPVRWS